MVTSGFFSTTQEVAAQVAPRDRGWLCRSGLALVLLLAAFGAVAVTSSIRPAGAEPVPPLVQVDVGTRHACALAGSGEAYCWGDDAFGQVGNGGAVTDDQVSPVPVDTPSGVSWASISAGTQHSCGVSTTGAAYCWGSDTNRQLGNGASIVGNQVSPSLVDTPAGVTWQRVSAGYAFTCGLTDAGSLYCWGAGDGGGPTSSSPALVAGGPWADVSTPNNTYRCAVTTAGTGFCWGAGDSRGILGNGPDEIDDQPTPFPVDTPPGVTWASIGTGFSSACGVTTTGAAYCWGSDDNGGLGNGTAISGDQHSPSPVDTPTGVVWSRIAPHSSGACGLTTTGKVYCWGPAEGGLLGNGFTSGSLQSPRLITSPAGVTWSSISARFLSACGTTTDGAIYCWGDNSDGKLGNGGVGGPVSLPSLVGAAQSITFDPIANRTEGSPPFAVNATASSGLSVSYQAAGPCSVSGSTVTVANDGICTITASQPGGEGWAAAAPVESSFTILPDDDGDGIANGTDNCPTTSNPGQGDFDGDGAGDACDADDDDDGVPDGEDAFPLDAAESVDTDGDGVGNNADADDDGDGVSDGEDAFPLDANESVDTDGDGTGNNADTDDDNDGVDDSEDAFPADPGESTDTDGDGIGNNADDDDDGDDIPDGNDPFPQDPGEALDTDGDGLGNNVDPDDDNDGIPDAQDGYPLERDGRVSGCLSRLIAANPALRLVLGPLLPPLRALGL